MFYMGLLSLGFVNTLCLIANFGMCHVRGGRRSLNPEHKLDLLAGPIFFTLYFFFNFRKFVCFTGFVYYLFCFLQWVLSFFCVKLLLCPRMLLPVFCFLPKSSLWQVLIKCVIFLANLLN